MTEVAMALSKIWGSETFCPNLNQDVDVPNQTDILHLCVRILRSVGLWLNLAMVRRSDLYLDWQPGEFEGST